MTTIPLSHSASFEHADRLFQCAARLMGALHVVRAAEDMVDLQDTPVNRAAVAAMQAQLSVAWQGMGTALAQFQIATGRSHMTHYCLGNGEPGCDGCGQEKNWQTLNQLPDALRKVLQAQMVRIDDTGCILRGRPFFKATEAKNGTL